MKDLLQQLLPQIKAAWRYRWLGVAAAWLICTVGWIGVSLQGDIYEASARFYVDTSSELRNVLSDQIIESNVESQLSFVREAMLGKSQLEAVAYDTGLTDGIQSEAQLAALLGELRAEINIAEFASTVDAGNRTSGLTYRITYQHPNRDKAREVVSTLLDNFFEYSLGNSLSGSLDSEEFLQRQIKEYERRLTDAEDRLARFNQKNYDRLPSMQGGYFNRLQSETQALDETRQELRLAQSRLDQIILQLRGESPTVTGIREIDPNSIEGRIGEAERRLDELLLRYTEQHPEVVAAREIVSQLKERQQTQLDEIAQSGGRNIGSNNPVYQALQIAQNEAEEEIAIIRADIEDRESRVAQLRGLIDEMPAVEAELARLNRDYEVVHDHYQSLLNSLERDRLSREVFQSEKIDFRVIDPPAAGTTPVAPKRALMLMAVYLAGCGAAVVVAYLLSQLWPTFVSLDSLRAATNLPIIGTVERVWSGNQRSSQFRSVVLVAMSFLSLTAVFAGVVFFEVMGPGLRSYL